jgi:hypothetical protein
MRALIHQYNKIIIEDNIYLYATITNYLTIAKNKLLLKQRHSDTNNHGEMIDCITHHVCQEITVEGWRDLDGDVDEDVGDEDEQPAGAPCGGRRPPWPSFFLGLLPWRWY